MCAPGAANYRRICSVRTSILVVLVGISLRVFGTWLSGAWKQPGDHSCEGEMDFVLKFTDYAISSHSFEPIDLVDASNASTSWRPRVLRAAYVAVEALGRGSADNEAVEDAVWRALDAQYGSKPGRLRNCLKSSPSSKASTAQKGVSYVASWLSGLTSYLSWTETLDTSNTEPLRHVVVGAGPVGLLSALALIRSGAQSVYVVEKRVSYTRNVWFDLYPLPWYLSQPTLEKLGLFAYQTAEYKEWPVAGGRRAITVRAQTLERFLAKVAVAAGVRVIYGHEFVGFCYGNSLSAVVGTSERNQSHFRGVRSCDNLNLESFGGRVLPFDVLIGADGARSTVAEAADIQSEPLTTFRLGHGDGSEGIATHVPDLHQASMIIHFRPSRDGNCPITRTDDRGTDPYFVGFLVPEVSAVFKRFYYGYCQMQILFTREAGDRLLATQEKNAKATGAPWLPWDLVIKVCHAVLQGPTFANVRELRAAIVKSSLTGSPEAWLKRVTVRTAEKAAIVLRGGPPSGDKNERLGVVLLAGDALSTAHYRLGVGINTGFAIARAVAEAAATGTGPRGIADRFSVASRGVLNPVLQLQASSMFYESYCSLIVFFDQNVSNLTRAQRLYARGDAPGQYDQVPMFNPTFEDPYGILRSACALDNA